MYQRLVVGMDKVADTDRDFYINDNETYLTLGRFSYINGMDIWAGGKTNLPHILIGRYCSLSRELLFILGFNHNYKAFTTYPKWGSNTSSKNPRQIIIGHDVWIGHGATIMGGVKIGNGAVIGAKAVVAKDIPPYAIAVGNPARVIKYRFDAETIKNFLSVKWWNWDIKKLEENLSLARDVEKFLEAHYSPEPEEFPEDTFSHRINKFAVKWREFNLQKNAHILPHLPDLEKFPEDKFTQKSNNFGGGGAKIYQFLPDFNAQNPLWLKVVKDFRQKKLENSLLVIWLDKDVTEDDINSLVKAVAFEKNILILKHDEKFSPAALRQGTHFITTREMSTLAALDYLWDTDVKIVSALDNGIFD